MSETFDMPEEARLDSIMIHEDNSVGILLRLPDGGGWMTVGFAAGSDPTRRLLALVGELVNERLEELAQRGLVVADYTDPEDRDDYIP